MMCLKKEQSVENKNKTYSIHRFVVDEWNRGASILVSNNPDTYIAEKIFVVFDDGLVNNITAGEELLSKIPDYVTLIERMYRKEVFGNSSNVIKLADVWKNPIQFHTGVVLIVEKIRELRSEYQREIFKRMCRYLKTAICKEHTFDNAWITAYRRTDTGYVVATFTEPDALEIKDEDSVKALDAYLYYLKSSDFQIEWLDSLLYRYDIYLKKIVQMVD